MAEKKKPAPKSEPKVSVSKKTVKDLKVNPGKSTSVKGGFGRAFNFT